MARNVVQEVQKQIARGCVLMTTKVKPRIGQIGGKHLVSVGPYRKAVGSKSFIVIGRGWEDEYGSARSAARAFTDYVGRDHAWNAAKTPRSCR